MTLYAACCVGDEDMMLSALGSPWVRTNLLQRKRALNGIKFTCHKNTLLHAACLSGNLKIVDLLCSLDADANVTNRDLDTPLHFAVSSGNVQIIAKLITANANINAANMDGLTPLHMATLQASESGQNSAMSTLLEGGAKILKDKAESTPLDIACEASDLEIINFLLMNEDFIDIDGHIRTLFLVLKRENTSVALKLLDNVKETSTRFKLLINVLLYAQKREEDMKVTVSKIKLLLKEKSNLLPCGIISLLKEAEDLRRLDIAELIRSHEADAFVSSTSVSLDTRNQSQQLGSKRPGLRRSPTFPDISEKSRRLELRRTSSSSGVEDKTPINFALYEACRLGDEDTVVTAFNSPWVQANLVERKRTFNELKFTMWKNTLLHAACISGNMNIVKFLCVYDVDANVTNQISDTPLHCAILTGNVQIIKQLFAINADVNAANVIGITPLHSATLFACKSGDFREVVFTLLEAGAKILKDKSEETPLDIACRHGKSELISMLLARKDFLDIEGHIRTLFLVLKSGNTSIALQILKNIKDTSTRFKVLVSVLFDAHHRNEDMNVLISNIKILLETNSEVSPDGICSLLKEAEDGLEQAEDIVELIRSEGAGVSVPTPQASAGNSV